MADRFAAPAVQKSLAVDLAWISHYDHRRNDVELPLVHTAQHHDAHPVYRRQSVPGIGQILRLVICSEIHDIARCPRVQEFVSYCRVVQCATASAGTRSGTAGTKSGHAYWKWAFSEAAGLFRRDHPAGQHYWASLEKTHGPGQA